MGIFLFWLGASVVVGIIASSRGRSGFGWFILSLLISPLLAVILVLALGASKSAAAAPDSPSPLTHVRCPDCKELVRADAVKCKHCGAALVPTDLSAVAAEADRQRRADKTADATAKWLIAAVLVAAGIVWFVGRR